MSNLLPSPDFSICVEVSCDPAAVLNLNDLPAKPGVFAFEDADGGTIALASTANLRRLVSSKLSPPPEAHGPTRRVNYRAVTRRIVATRVDSRFEADWAYLQAARVRLPATYRGLLDRWQAWFVQCNPDVNFPQWMKTAHPTSTPENQAGPQCFGPMPDKHAAGRFIDVVEDAFDLCRYHHILVQAPNATACAYKEMGRCPAPCDGSISMDEYREQIRESMRFAGTPIHQWRSEIETIMAKASASLDFETAQRQRELLDRAAAAMKTEFAHVRHLRDFAFLAIMPGEQKSLAKIFLIRGGWIERIGTIALDAKEHDVKQIIERSDAARSPREIDFSVHAIENIGMTCWHLFRQRNPKAKGAFLRLDQQLDPSTFLAGLKTLRKDKSIESMDAQDDEIADRDLENLNQNF